MAAPLSDGSSLPGRFEPAPKLLAAPSTVALLPQALPLARSSFIGRGTDLEALRQVLTDRRLVTIVGVGGGGKTRLALEVARQLTTRFAGGAVFVDLSPIKDSDLAWQAVGASLGLRNLAPVELSRVVGEAELLLVIDNAEYVIDEVAPVVSDLITRCPNLRILITSRSPLGVEGETCWRLPGLPLPPDGVHDPAELLTYDAVRLFCVRAEEMGADFVLTAANAPLVARICRQLDAIPLALELAAARVVSLGLDEIVAQLARGLRVLSWERRDVAARHSTMNATIEWSYNLLEWRARRLFQQLSVFVNEFDLHAARTLCASEVLAGDEFTDVLQDLIRNSLVMTASQADGSMRYRLLEVLRQYASRALSQAEEQRLAMRHANHYGKVVTDVSDGTRRDGRHVFQRLDVDYHNIRKAMEWAALADPELEVRFARSLGTYWAFSGSVREGRERIRSVLAKPQVSVAQRIALSVEACRLALMADDAPGAALCIEGAIELLDEVADDDLVVRAYHLRALVGMWCGDLERAEQDLGVAVRVLEGGVTLHAAWVLNSLAGLLEETGRYEEAEAAARRALELNAAVGDEPLVRAEINYRLGTLGLRTGKVVEANLALTEALMCAVRYDLSYLATDYLSALALAAHGMGDAGRCLELLGAASRCAGVAAARGANRVHMFGLRTDDAEATSRSRLGGEAAKAAWSRGLAMDLQQVLERVLMPADEPDVSATEVARPPAITTATGQLRRVRQRHSLTQEDVARQLGTRKVTVSRWERGIQAPSLYFQRKLCSLFQTTPRELGLDAEEPTGDARRTSRSSPPVAPD
jgi:non-specific serine/threonine protein kinase